MDRVPSPTETFGTMSTQNVMPGARLGQLASEKPDDVALVVQQIDGTASTLTRGELDRWSSRLAHRLALDGAGPQSFVAIHLPTSLEHVVATLAAYKLGACPMPISHRMPESQRDAMADRHRARAELVGRQGDRESTRLNSSQVASSYAVFGL